MREGGNVLWKLGTILLIPAAAMAPVGAYVGSHAPKIALLWALTAFLSYTLYNLVRERAKVRSSRFYGSVKGYVLTALVGVITGFLSGMLGIGGAILILPVMVLIEEDIKKASATTGIHSILISVSGFTSYLLLLREKLWLVMLAERLWLVVLTGGSLGGLTGSYLLNRLRPFYVKYIVVLIIALVLMRIFAKLI
jgi:Predicted permeases